MRASRMRQRIRGLPRNMAEVNRSLQHLASLRGLGWHESLRRLASVDAMGGPLPWYTYSCIEWLSTRLRPTDTVFEFGAGFSTLWYGQRTRTVVSVEHDPAWFRRLANTLPNNVDLRLCDAHADEIGELEPKNVVSNYAASIQLYPTDSFDVIVIDGMERLTCTMVALPRLKEEGLLIFDNSDRPVYRPAIEHLTKQGLGRIDFHGFSPGLGIPGCTSVFARSFERWLGPTSAIRTWGL